MMKRAVICSSLSDAKDVLGLSRRFGADGFDLYASADLLFDELFNDGTRFDLVVLDHCEYDCSELETASRYWPEINFVVIDPSSTSGEKVFRNIFYLRQRQALLI